MEEGRKRKKEKKTLLPRYVLREALDGKKRSWLRGRLLPLPQTDATFEVSWWKNKKYAAVLPGGRVIHFGDSRYEHFLDRVPNQAWAHLNHLDETRLQKFRARFATLEAVRQKESAAWFSYYFLW